MNTLVSIIVPVYNASSYLKKCIDSILTQTVHDFEIIIVDDGSTDDTPVICDQYAKTHFQIKVIHQANAGVSTARNKGLSIASGKWVTFVDCDDTISCDFLEQADNDKEVDLIVSNYVNIINGNESLNSYPYAITNDLSTKEYLNKYIATEIFQAPWSKFFKTSLIKDFSIVFDTTLAFAEDMIFNLEYLKHTNRILFSNRGTYFYYSPNNMLGELKYKINILQLITLSDKFYKLSSELRLDNSTFQSYYIYLWTIMEEYCLRHPVFSERERKSFYKTSYQMKYSSEYLSTRSFVYRGMYMLCKTTPHWFNNKIIKGWLNFVYKRNIK